MGASLRPIDKCCWGTRQWAVNTGLYIGPTISPTACFWPKLCYSWSPGPRLGAVQARRRHLFLLRARPLKIPHLHQPSMAEEQMEEASTAAAEATPFQLQFDKPIPFQVSSRLRSLPCLSSLHSQTQCARARGDA
jgi:hypothetical protein